MSKWHRGKYDLIRAETLEFCKNAPQLEKYINSKICISPSFLAPKMTTIASTLKHAFDNITENAKVKDLSTDTVEITSSSGLTTDNGVKVSDTDNWYCSGLLVLDYLSHQRFLG